MEWLPAAAASRTNGLFGYTDKWGAPRLQLTTVYIYKRIMRAKQCNIHSPVFWPREVQSSQPAARAQTRRGSASSRILNSNKQHLRHNTWPEDFAAGDMRRVDFHAGTYSWLGETHPAIRLWESTGI